MPRNQEGVSLGHGRCERTSEKALLVQIGGNGAVRSIWIPKSCVHDDSEVYELLHEGNVVVMEWWAEKEGLA